MGGVYGACYKMIGQRSRLTQEAMASLYHIVMYKNSRHPKFARPTRILHRQNSARTFGVPAKVLVLAVLGFVLFATYLVWSICISVAEHANALVASGAHPDVSTALTAMFMEYVGVPLMYLAAFLIFVGVAVSWVKREFR